ncbi:class I SAM-dependent methyltransferase [Candidatus Bathyarchaeota archaeon]|nr:class I SAM-dependent methyltransferase [Candidatus Bathyarchaeota archaeon]
MSEDKTVPAVPLEKLVKKYYSEQGMKEWKRLVRDAYHRLEFDTTMHFLRKHLLRKGLILDAGGGPGRYTIALGRLGYHIVLFDLSPEMLKIAEKQVKRAKVQRQVKQIIQGSIDDLSMFRDNTFDGTICLGGALSHILDKNRREKAIDELIRVTKKSSPIFISLIGRLAVLVTELICFPQEIEIEEVFQSIRDTGDYYGGYGFAPCHFYLPEEIEASLKKRKVTILEMVGLEGLSSGHQKETNRLFKKYPKAWKIWWETHLKTCTHPCTVAISEHFLVICKKQSS